LSLLRRASLRRALRGAAFQRVFDDQQSPQRAAVGLALADTR
jgi:hypothetical protein